MASFQTFVDPLISSTQNTTLWGGNFGTLSWVGGGFTITNPINYTGYGGQDTLAAYDLTGVSFYCQMANVGNQALASCETFPFVLIKDASNTMSFYVTGGNVSVLKKIAGVQSTVATAVYNSSTHKWFRARESGGTTFFDTSADGRVWTNFTSLANPFAVTALSIEASLGTYSLEASSTTAKWLNFSTPALNNQSLTTAGV